MWHDIQEVTVSSSESGTFQVIAVVACERLAHGASIDAYLKKYWRVWIGFIPGPTFHRLQVRPFDISKQWTVLDIELSQERYQRRF